MLVTQSNAKDFSVFFDSAGLTISNVYLSKNGGVQVDVVGGVTVSDRGNGQYRIAPVNSHFDTLGEALFIVVDSTGEKRPKVIQVVPWSVETDFVTDIEDALACCQSLDTNGVKLSAQGITDVGTALATYDGPTKAEMDSAFSAISSAITNLNNLSAKCNLFGPMLLEIPDSGSIAYRFEMVVRDDEDKLTNLDASPTIGLLTHAGASRSSYVGTVSNPSTGIYRFTITIASTDPKEGLMLTAIGATSGEERQAKLGLAVVDYDTQTLLAAIDAKIGTPVASVAGDIATVKSKLLKYVQLMSRKDAAIYTDNATELTEINANGGSGAGTFAAGDALEGIKDSITGGGIDPGDLAEALILEFEANPPPVDLVEINGEDIEAGVIRISVIDTGFLRNGLLTIVQGDDYNTALGNRLKFEDTTIDWSEIDSGILAIDEIEDVVDSGMIVESSDIDSVNNCIWFTVTSTESNIQARDDGYYQVKLKKGSTCKTVYDGPAIVKRSFTPCTP